MASMPGTRISGDLRFIARRVFLDKIPLPGLTGRGTLDARLALKDGRVSTATWEANARELVVNDGRRFDHLTVNGSLSRDAGDVLLDLTDLQLTRGARLERAPVLKARLRLDPDLKIARTTVHADRIPFMAAEFVASLLAPQASQVFPEMPGGWMPTAGELRDVDFDSGARRTGGRCLAAVGSYHPGGADTLDRSRDPRTTGCARAARCGGLDAGLRGRQPREPAPLGRAGAAHAADRRHAGRAASCGCLALRELLLVP
jgi:hypothetical protein